MSRMRIETAEAHSRRTGHRIVQWLGEPGRCEGCDWLSPAHLLVEPKVAAREQQSRE